MRNKPIPVLPVLFVWLLIVSMMPGNSCGQDRGVSGDGTVSGFDVGIMLDTSRLSAVVSDIGRCCGASPIDLSVPTRYFVSRPRFNEASDPIGSNVEIDRKSKPLFFRFLGSLGWGKFQNQLREAFSDYRSLTLGLGIRYRGAYVELTGAVGASKLAKDYLGVYRFDEIDTTLFGHSSTSLLFGHALYRIGRFRLSPFAGIKWSAIRYDIEEPPSNIGWKSGYQAGLKAEFLVGHTGQAKHIERSHHYLFLRLGIGKWVYNDLFLEEGHLLSISIGYQLDVVVIEF